MKGAIIEKNENYILNLSKIIHYIVSVKEEYNWLILNYECYPQKDINKKYFSKQYCWISSDNLKQLLEEDTILWIWGDFFAFNKSISLNQVLQEHISKGNGYLGFWKNPITIRHSLAETEVVAWDSELTLFVSRDDDLIEEFQKYFSECKDLYEYNKE